MIDKQISFFIVLMGFVVMENSSADIAINQSTEASLSLPKESPTYRILEPDEFISEILRTDTVYKQNPYQMCNYVGAPMIITFPTTCGSAKGSYCHATVKCSSDTGDNTDTKWYFFCKTTSDGKCPDPVACYNQPDEEITRKLKVTYKTDSDLGTIKSMYVKEGSFSRLAKNVKEVAEWQYRKNQEKIKRFGSSSTVNQTTTSTTASSDSAQRSGTTTRTKKSGGFSVFGFLKRLFGGGRK